ncbi:DUF1275 domain-containing protein [Roseomonas sp. OT10]|uniref:YoaK family protein n=1 Tax=Roseomonas cutis TaxID=2897332 RepID=UPI001E5C891E|nr:YoaK family protein [Roseomonas sp. OT10]UFN50178.1 DUF1275 domain-containing protein [Roseomonas sp. OT10]
MRGHPRHHVAAAFLLAAVAGFVDGIGFLHLGGIFVSFMSGNSTRLGVEMAALDGPGALRIAAILLTFVIGAGLGSLVGRHGQPGRRRHVLVLVGVLLPLADLLHMAGAGMPAMVALVLAMGAENAVFQRDSHDPGIALTYMTGALVKVGQRLAAALSGGDRWAWVPNLLHWLSLSLGALCGALAYGQFGLHGLWLASAVVLALAAMRPPPRPVRLRVRARVRVARRAARRAPVPASKPRA